MDITLETAADKLVKEIFGVKPEETVIITADDDSDASVVEAVKNSAKNAGAHAMVISVPTPGGVGKAADPDLPVDALSAALLCADVWIEFNHQWLLYSTPFERAEAENKKMRTLLNQKDQMSPYSRIELNRLIDSGAKFTVSTGRTPATIRESLPGIHLKLPVIAMDGAVLYDLNENSYLMKYQMSTSQAQTICDFFDRKGISYFTNCVVDDLLVIYYDQLISPLHQEVYERRHRSPHRNYVQKTQSVYENVVYLYLLDKKEIMEKLYRELMEQEWIDSYRVAFHDPIRYPGCANIKIYIKDATRENMLRNLKALLNLDKVITIRKCGRQIRCLYRRYR